MSFPLLGPIGKIIKIAGSILGVDSVKDVVDAISNNKLTPEQKLQLEQAVLEHEAEMRQLDTEQMKLFVSEAVAEIQSSDKWVARARPTGLYLAYLFTGFAIVSLVFGTVEKELVSSILMLLAPFWGSGGYYMHLRSKEKLNGNHSE